MKINLNEFEIYRRYKYALSTCSKFFDIDQIKCFIVLLYNLGSVYELNEIIKRQSK